MVQQISATTVCLRYARILTVLLFIFFSFSSTFAQCTVVCKSDLNISLGPSGIAVISPALLLQDPTCDPADFSVEIIDGLGNNYGDTLSCDVAGETVAARVIQIIGGNYCETMITVNDYFSPTVEVRDTFITCAASFSVENIGRPRMFDNCTDSVDLIVNFTDEITDLDCYTMVNGDTATAQIVRTWEVTDLQGNTTTTTQNIYLQRAVVDDIVFPANIDGTQNPALDCSDDPNDLDLTGRPTIGGDTVSNNGFCEFVVSYSDQTVDICGSGGYRILRTWNIVDWCSGDFRIHVQLILVQDTITPNLTLPDDVTVGMDYGDCGATVNLPTATASDNCSGVTITPSWSFGSGYGPFASVPPGVHQVIYTAVDDCGNSVQDTLAVTVIDDTPPIAICESNVNISLSIDGTGQAGVGTFDDGSFDNCMISHMQISKTPGVFDSIVYFDCNDLLQDSLMVWLRVYDEAGNYNECETVVHLRDYVPPVIICPADRTIICTDDPQDFSLTGQPSVSDNCMIDTVFYTDQIDLNACNVGQINRTWTTIDLYGNSSFCTQTITVEDPTPLAILFPTDTTLFGCMVGTAPAVTGTIQLINDQCEDVGISYTDEIFTVAAPACYKILRTWTVIETCIYQSNSGSNAGFYEATQVIIVHDNEAPIITCPSDTLVLNYNSDCSGIFVNLRPATAMDCSLDLTISNNSVFALANGADASGVYPIGTHEITFTAVDGCGNSSTCLMILEVVDAKPPTAICKSGISISIDINGFATIYPSLIDNGSFDNCTDSADLLISVFPNTFDCDDLGLREVTFTVTDDAGNTASCTSMITISDDLQNCPFANIRGTISNEAGAGVSEVQVSLAGNASDEFTTNSDGQFAFLDLPTGAGYSIIPRKNIRAINGVSTRDLVILARHILDLSPLDSPYKRIAADINNSGTITAFDMVHLRKMILFITQEFTDNTSWRFVREDYVFPNMNNPFQSSFPEVFTVEQLNQSIDNANFVAIKIGDLNDDARPNRLLGEESQDRNGSGHLVISDQKLKAGQEYLIPIQLGQATALSGFQFDLRINDESVEILEVINGKLDMTNSFASSLFDEGILRTSYYNSSAEYFNMDDTLFYVKIGVLSDQLLSNIFYLMDADLAAEYYDEHIESYQLRLLFEAEKIKSERSLFQNFPNPFTTQTNIQFTLDKGMDVQLKLFSENGSEVLVRTISGKPGVNTVVIDKRSIGEVSGLYFYSLTAVDGWSETRKMIIY